ncbi:MAG TPA: hypothetical protein VJT82_08975, partial [Pyrinomonadaceae bacterium]|nr:hypothetical protein [Pyrinomonadaceae bacterium]
MTIVKRTRTISAWLALLVLLIPLCAGRLARDASAQSFSRHPEKISPDLRERIRNAPVGGGRVKM